MAETIVSVFDALPPQRACTLCGVEKPLEAFAKHKLGKYGRRPRCRECMKIENAAYRSRTMEQRAAYNARWKREHPENHRAYNYAWVERNPEKIEAHRQLRNADRRGDILRPIHCEGCGKACRLHAHHPDYQKPLEVLWLCPRCHKAEHRKEVVLPIG